MGDSSGQEWVGGAPAVTPAAAALRRDWDVIVIGAGVLGCFHAYFARQRGLRTLLIERGDLPADASVRNFGTLVPSAMTAGPWLKRGLESIRHYRHIAEHAPIPLKCEGTQYLATTPAEVGVLEEFARIGPPLGYRCEFLAGQQSAELNPVLDPHTCVASLHFPDDARVDARRLFGVLIPWLRDEAGCAYLPRTHVADVSVVSDECAVSTAAGVRLTAGHVFVCSGADLRSLFPGEFVEAGLVRCKLQMLRTIPQRSARLTASLASGLSIRWYPSFRVCRKWEQLQEEHVDPEVTRRGIHVLMVQDGDGRFVIGDSHEYSNGDLTDELDATTESLIVREAGRLMRLPNWEVSERWQGIYAMHPEQPLFQKTLDNRIHLVTGIGGKGMTTGPAVARESIDQVFGIPSGSGA